MKMHMIYFRKQVFLFFIIVIVRLTVPLHAQVSVYGSDPAYAGDTLHILAYDDMISYTPVELCKIPVQDDGNFKGSFDLNTTQKVFVNLGKYQVFLFVEPGHSYNIVLPPYREKEIRDILNPYFRPEIIHSGILNTDSMELNVLINKFDRIYDPFFYRHARSVYTAQRDDHLEVFIDSLTRLFSTVQTPFFRDYIQAKLMALRVMTIADRKRVLQQYTSYARKVKYANPAYMELFNQVFNRYFGYLKRGRLSQNLTDAVMKYNNPDTLYQVLAFSVFTTDPAFLEMVAMKSIYDGIYNNDYPKENLVSLLGKILETTTIPVHKKICKNLLDKIHFLEPGSLPPEFTLSDVYGKKYSLSGFRGKYLYLNFSSRLSYSSLRQFPILQKIYDRYRDSLEVVTIAPEDNPDALLNMVTGRKYSWKFLVCPPSCSVIDQYRIRVFPSYLLLSPEGKIINYPAPAPTENFESLFEKILKESKLQ